MKNRNENRLRVRTTWNNNNASMHIQMQGTGEYANRDYGYSIDFNGHPKVIEWLAEQTPVIPSLNSELMAYLPAELFIYNPNEDEEGEETVRILIHGKPKNHVLGALIELDTESSALPYLCRFAMDNEAADLSWVHSIKEELNLCTVVDLKRRLKDAVLPVGGKKADLVKKISREMIRLAQEMSEE